jgi:hypothetical protein
MMSGGAASWFVQRLRARRHLAGSRVVSPSASGDPVFIPHDVETRGVLTRIDRSRIPRSVIHFRLRRRSRTRLGSTSQGGDTGSSPVGTAHLDHVEDALGGAPRPPWPFRSRAASSPTISPGSDLSPERTIAHHTPLDLGWRPQYLHEPTPPWNRTGCVGVRICGRSERGCPSPGRAAGREVAWLP